MGKSIRDIVIDEVMDAYVEWRQESAGVESAYERWSTAPPSDTALAFAAYVAALDREARASILYAEVMQRNSMLCRSERWVGVQLRDAA
jgi:hypothetical protein